MRMVSEFGCSPQYLRDLCGIYRETQSVYRGGRPGAPEARGPGATIAASGGFWRPRPSGRTRPAQQRTEFQRARTGLIADLIGRSAVTVKLRPAGR